MQTKNIVGSQHRPAFMSHFKIGSILYKDDIIANEKLFPLALDIDFKKVEYIPFRGLTFHEQHAFSNTAYKLLSRMLSNIL